MQPATQTRLVFARPAFLLALALLFAASGPLADAQAQRVPNTEVSAGPAPIKGRPATGGTTQPFGGGQSSLAFGIDNGPAQFVSLDLQNPGTVTPINTVPQNDFVGAGDVSPDGTVAYQIDGVQLYEVATGTGTATLVGSLGTPQTFTGLAYDVADDTYYGATSDCFTSFLYEVDVAAAAATLIGELTNAPCAIALASTPTGELYSYDIVNDVFLSVDKGTGAGTVIGPIGFDANFGQGMTYDYVNDVMVMAAFNDGTGLPELRVVDLATGSTTLVGVLDVGQMSWIGAPANGIVPQYPELVYSPAMLEFVVDPDGSATETLTIQNVGAGDLTFSLSPVLGYNAVDSDEPGGPAFEAIDISGTGTVVPFVQSVCLFPWPELDEGFADLPLPFTFTFFGVDYTSVRVYPNGLLTFDLSDQDCTFLNQPIPTPGWPDALIAPLWTDLDATVQGSIEYETLGDGRFVVQWTDVPLFGGSIGHTFQVVLSASGEIKYQYVEAGEASNYTIGVENQDGSGGLQVAFGGGFVHDSLAVLISLGDAYITDISPSSGTVAPGDMVTVDVTADATGLAVGSYDQPLTLTTNAPNAAEVTIPTTLAVGTANEGGSGLPTSFAVSGSYPNPASALTTIRYQLPEAAHVRVEVYDAVGRRVAVLVDEEQGAAFHEVSWDAGALANGLYVCRVQAGDRSETVKMVVAR